MVRRYVVLDAYSLAVFHSLDFFTGYTCAIPGSIFQTWKTLGIGSLRSSPGTTTRHTTSTTALTTKVATSALASSTASVHATTTSAAGCVASASVTVVGSAIGAGLGAAGLNHNALAINDMGVGSSSSVVTSGVGKLNESTALYHLSVSVT